MIEGVTAHMGAPPTSGSSARSEGSEGNMNDATTDGGDTSSRPLQQLHDASFDLEWSPSEQSILTDGLAKCVFHTFFLPP